MEIAHAVAEFFGWVFLLSMWAWAGVLIYCWVKDRFFSTPLHTRLLRARQEGRCDERDKVVRLLEHEADACQDAAIAVLFQTAANRIDYPDKHYTMSIYDLWQSKLQSDAKNRPTVNHVAADCLFEG